MKKNINIKIIFRILKISGIFFIVLVSTMSIFNIINQEKIANYHLQETVFKNGSNILLGIERIITRKDKQQNSISDYFQPKYTFLIKTNEKIGGYKIDFRRGVFQELQVNSVSSFTLDDSKTFDERLNEFENNKLIIDNASFKNLKVKFEGVKNTESYRQINGFDPVEEYYDGLKSNDSEKKFKGWSLQDYSNFKKGINSYDLYYGKYGEIKIDNAISSYIPEFLNTPEIVNIVEDPSYPNLIYVNLHFSKGLNLDELVSNKNSFLERILLVKKDRSYIEIPPKADGTFDFESIKDKLK